MNSWKIQAVVEWFTFNNLTQIQFFINFWNFYQRFIKNFLKIVRLMIQLTQKKIIFEWNEICQMTFNIDHLTKSAKIDYRLIKLASVKNICLVKLLAHKL